MAVADDPFPSVAPKNRLRLNALITTVALAAVVIVIAAVIGAFTDEAPSWPALVGIVALILLGDFALFHVRVGPNRVYFSWDESALVLSVIVVGWNWYLALAWVTVLTSQIATGRPARKAMYNASTIAVSGGLARVAFWLVTGTWTGVESSLSWLGAAGLMLATSVHFFATVILVTLAVALAQGATLREVRERMLSGNLLTFLGNLLAAAVVVAVWRWSPSSVVVLPFFFIVLYLIYNNFLRAQRERDTWRELHRATLSLQRVNTPDLLIAVRRGADKLFGAERTELLSALDPSANDVVAPGLLELGLGAHSPLVLRAERSEGAVRRELIGLGLHTAVLAPLGGHGERVGALLLGFRGPISIKHSELRMLATFSDQIAISLRQASLFEELSSERGRLAAIVHSASDGIMLLDTEGRICSWNAAMTRMTGQSASDVLGRPLGEALVARTHDGILVDGQALIAGLADTDETWLAIVFPTTGGQEREAAVAASAVRDREGHTEYAVLVARDVTTQREVEQAKQDFIATVSHELRTPLTPLKGYLSLMLRPDFQPDEAKRSSLLRILLDQTNHLERLVEDLLSVSRMQHGEFSVRPEVVDVSDVVERAVRDIASVSERAVEVSTDESALLAVCDPARLQQVVTNLLSNADKYSPAAEPITVWVGRHGDAEVEVSVRDHGEGIPADSREAVFEPFRRLGDPLTRETRGTGLGLHIARQLIESMHGRIWVDGDPGEGATFHLTVPTPTADTDPARPSARSAGDRPLAHSAPTPRS